MITDGESEVKEPDQIDPIIKQLLKSDTSVNIIAIDFCNELEDMEDSDESLHSDQDGEGEDDKDDDDKPNGHQSGLIKKPPTQNNNQNQNQVASETDIQASNRSVFEKFVSKIKGAIFPANVAISIFKQFQKRDVSKRTKFRGPLELASDLNLNVCVFTKSTEEKMPSLKKHSLCVDRSDDVNTGEVIRQAGVYCEADDPEKKETDPEDIVKAYFYGKQLVPIEKINEEVLKFNDDRCLKMLGFTDTNKVPRQHYMSGCDVVVPVESARNRRAFSALVTAMIETDKVMIAKWVSRKNAAPKLVVLHPHQEPKFECLYMNILPTVEDIRDYQFGSLVQSTEAQQKAMDDFVDALDLDEGEPEEAVQDEQVIFNPTLQYFNQCVIHRIYNDPNSELPEPNQTIGQHVRPEEQTFQQAQEQVEELESAFEIEENVEETVRLNRRFRLRDIVLEGAAQEEEKKEVPVETAPEQEGEQLVTEGAPEKSLKYDFNEEEKVDKISSTNPVKDFDKMINDREKDRVEEALTQMKQIILEFIKNSIQGDIYEKAIDCLRAMRKACKDNDEPGPYNEYIRMLKDKYSNGAHSQFYKLIQQNTLGLITRDESFKSNVTKEEADEFLGVENQPEQPDQNDGKKDEDNDKSMFDDIE